MEMADYVKWCNIYVTITTFYLVIQSEAQTYIITESASSAESGKPFTFTCQTTPPEMAVSWTETSRDNIASTYTYFLSSGICKKSTGTPPGDYVFDCNSTGTFTVTFNPTFERHEGSQWKCGNSIAPTPESSVSVPNVIVPLTSLIVNISSAPNVTETTPVTITCATNPCYPVPPIIWMKDGNEHQDPSIKQTSTRKTNGFVGESEISKTVSVSDSGSYSCKAVYGTQTVFSTNSINLNVQAQTTVCVCDVGNIIFIVLLLICLVSKFGSHIYFLTHSYFPKNKYRNPSDHKVGFALETTIKWTEEYRPQHSAYNENKMKIENEIKELCGNRITIQNLYFENINKHLRISFHFMEEDVIFSTFSQRFTNGGILGKEIKKVTEQKYHIHEGRFELFKNGFILVNESESTACKVSLEYNYFLFPVITLKSLTNEGKEIKRPVKKSHPVCLMRLLTILNIVMVVAALIFFLVCSLQELERCRLGIGVIVVDGIALIWWIVNIIVLTVCRDWIWITYEISIDVELTANGNGTGSGGSQGSNYNKTSSSESITHPSKLPKQNKPTDRSDSTQAPVYDNETLRKMKKEPPPQPTSTDRHSASSVRLQVMETPKQSE